MTLTPTVKFTDEIGLSKGVREVPFTHCWLGRGRGSYRRRHPRVHLGSCLVVPAFGSMVSEVTFFGSEEWI